MTDQLQATLWPGSKLVDNKQVLLDGLGFVSETETIVGAISITREDLTKKRFPRGKGKFVSCAWLQWCAECGMKTVEQLLADGAEFFGPDIWDDEEKHAFIACLKRADSVTIILDDEASYTFMTQEETQS